MAPSSQLFWHRFVAPILNHFKTLNGSPNRPLGAQLSSKKLLVHKTAFHIFPRGDLLESHWFLVADVGALLVPF